MFPIGISGYARSGKTTLANILCERHGYRRKHIAEPLRSMLRPLLRRAGLREEIADTATSRPTIDDYLTGSRKEQVVPVIGRTSRYLQITLGTEWGRNLVHPDLWVNLWKQGVNADDAVINDSVRFPNEMNAVHELGGITILITRKGVGPAAYTFWWGKLLYKWFGIMWGVHDSERIDRLDFDYVIDNDGTIDDLVEKIDDIIEYEKGLRCGS